MNFTNYEMLMLVVAFLLGYCMHQMYLGNKLIEGLNCPNILQGQWCKDNPRACLLVEVQCEHKDSLRKCGGDHVAHVSDASDKMNNLFSVSPRSSTYKNASSKHKTIRNKYLGYRRNNDHWWHTFNREFKGLADQYCSDYYTDDGMCSPNCLGKKLTGELDWPGAGITAALPHVKPHIKCKQDDFGRCKIK
jgi:hypothetical protein